MFNSKKKKASKKSRKEVEDGDNGGFKSYMNSLSINGEKKSLSDEELVNSLRTKYFQDFSQKCHEKNTVYVYGFEDATQSNLSKYCVLINLTTGEQKECLGENKEVPDKKFALMTSNKFVFSDTKICFCHAKKEPANSGFVLAVTGFPKTGKPPEPDTRPLSLLVDFYEILSGNDKRPVNPIKTLLTGNDGELLISCLKTAEVLGASIFQKVLRDVQKKYQTGIKWN